MHNQDQFRVLRVPSYSQLKFKVLNIFVTDTTLHINLNIDDAPVVSHTHTPLPLTNLNLSPPIHLPALLRSPILPLNLLSIIID
jgi:hypothetical protein